MKKLNRSERTKARNRGKDLERRVSKALGTSRHLRKGDAEPDLIFGATDNFIGECKHRSGGIALHRWFEQCRKYAANRSGKTPVLFTQEKGKQPMVTMELDAFVALLKGAGMV